MADTPNRLITLTSMADVMECAPRGASHPTGEAAIEYWVRHLEGLPALQLPTDYPRPVPIKYVEAEEVLRLSKNTSRLLLKLSLDADVAPFTVILTAFSILLHKYTREEDVVVGSSSQNFNPLILRIPRISGTETFLQLVQLTRDIEENAAKYEVPYQDIYNRLRPPVEDGPSGPLFQVRFFNLIDVNASTLDAASCDWTVFVEQLSDAKLLLPLQLRIVYNNILFSRERILEVLRQIEMLLETALTRPDIVVNDISLVTPHAKRVLPNPNEALDESFFGSIQSRLSDNARKYPDRPAIIDRDNVYSYRVVDMKSNRVANFLIAHGIEKGAIVAIFAHRSTALVYAIMGILKAGATFTVIDPQYPPERQIVYLQVAQPCGLITIKAAGNLHADVQKYIDTELNIRALVPSLSPDEDGVLADVSIENPNIPIGPDDIGTLSFTSGSTGIPKGVRGRHVSYTHFYPWMAEEFRLDENDRFSMLSGIAHDPIQRDIFTPFFLGASIHIPDAEDIGNPGQLAKWMSTQGVTVTHLTPAMGQLLTANATTKMPALKCALFVGDILTKRDVSRLQALAPNVKVVNMYGTTETQRAVSYLTVSNDNSMEKRKEILPAGQGMKDVQLLILTPHLHLCGVGELGEIYQRSAHMAAGYLGLEEATRQKFFVNPFNQDNHRDRLYKTGDLGRYMPDGIVECVGRADDQVKIRGFRIELGEIDTHLSQHPAIRENVTVVRRDINEEHVLVSYFVPHKDDFDIADIRAHLKTKLPSYAIPSIFVPLTSMPLTPNGKIDKTKLPFPDTAVLKQRQLGKESQLVSNKPRNQLETRLADIWCSALNLPTIGTHDNFFDLGGHSIVATRVIFQMRQALKVDLPLMLLFEHPTIASIAQAIKVLDGDVAFEGELAPAPEPPKPMVDFNAETELDPSITTGGKTFVFNAQPEHILLTGGTGFLGAFILEALLQHHPQAIIHCHVRANTIEQGFARIKKNMEDHLVWDPSFQGRVEVVLGDLGKPQLGLGQMEFEELGRKIQAIYHNGAMVHWVFPYEKLKAINVTSTVDCLRLAALGPTLAPVHFVSSTSVFDADYYVAVGDRVSESDDLSGGVGLSVGYGQSKWVAERLLFKARARGFPITITRPGYVVGHSRTGVTNVDDYIWRLAKGCAELKFVPIMNNSVNMCPVDYVAACIALIGASESAIGKAFHMSNPDRFRFNELFDLMREYGFEMQSLEYVQWRQLLMDYTMASADNALYPLLHYVLDDLPTKSKAPDLDATNTLALIVNTGVNCQSMKEVMGTYLSYLVQSGFLFAPLEGERIHKLPKLDVEAKILMRSGRGPR